MKIRYAVIASIVLFITAITINEAHFYIAFELRQLLITILLLLWFVSLGLIAYLIIRNAFRAIKGAVTGTPAGDYRAEARKACEKITPKQK